ncbi:MAG: hypothetical protein JWM80_5151 [Cyanobacteria bacterium RYN_339]|nr:hypothetical protein [Cyanobacteria bacterium RYN_339]
MGNGPAGVSFKDINNYQRQFAARVKTELETQRPTAAGAVIDKQEEALAKDDVVSSQAIRDYAKENGWDTNELNAALAKYDGDQDGLVNEQEFDKLAGEMQDHEDRALVNEIYDEVQHRPPTDDEMTAMMAHIQRLRDARVEFERMKKILKGEESEDEGGAAPPAPGGSAAPSGGAPAASGGSPGASGGSPGASGGSPGASGGSPAASGGSPTGGESSGSSAPAAAAGPAQEASTATTAKAGQVPYINQYSDSNSNNGSNCGPTSMAMIAKAFGYGTNLSNGDLIATLGAAGGTTEAGTSWAGINAMAAKMGKPCQEHAPDAGWIKQQLEAGKLVCANGDYYSMAPHDASKRGQGGHYVAVIGMDANGNFLVNDPADKGISPKAYTADQLNAFMHGNKNGGQAFAIG